MEKSIQTPLGVYTDDEAGIEMIESYAKQYALNLFEQYLDGEKTIAEISQELKDQRSLKQE
jgi:hypothetical protein